VFQFDRSDAIVIVYLMGFGIQLVDVPRQRFCEVGVGVGLRDKHAGVVEVEAPPPGAGTSQQRRGGCPRSRHWPVPVGGRAVERRERFLPATTAARQRPHHLVLCDLHRHGARCCCGLAGKTGSSRKAGTFSCLR
jgi:hypothetical protein